MELGMAELPFARGCGTGVCSVLGQNSRITPRASCWSFPSGLFLLLGVHSTKQKLVKNVGKCSGFVNFGIFFLFQEFFVNVLKSVVGLGVG